MLGGRRLEGFRSGLLGFDFGMRCGVSLVGFGVEVGFGLVVFVEFVLFDVNHRVFDFDHFF